MPTSGMRKQLVSAPARRSQKEASARPAADDPPVQPGDGDRVRVLQCLAQAVGLVGDAPQRRSGRIGGQCLLILGAVRTQAEVRTQ